MRNADAARQHFDNALPLYEALDEKLGEANTLKSLGNVELQLGNVDAACQHFDNALRLYEALDDQLGKANMLESLRDVELQSGNVHCVRIVQGRVE